MFSIVRMNIVDKLFIMMDKIIFNNVEYDGKNNNYGEIRIIIRIINIMSIKIIV